LAIESQRACHSFSSMVTSLLTQAEGQVRGAAVHRHKIANDS
jgi:hypothetical protein